MTKEEKKETKLKGEEIEQKDKQNLDKIQKAQLNKILFVIGAVAVLFLVGVFVVDSIRNFEYKGIDFKIVKEGELVLYNTFFEMYSITGKHVADYNLYFRNDPRDLGHIPFEGEIDLDLPLKKMVIKMEDSQNLNCEGYGVIATANLVKSFGLLGIEIVKDEKVECDAQGRYMYVKVREGEKSKIEEYGPSCYRLIVNNCEILEVTEKFIVEAMIEKGDNSVITK